VAKYLINRGAACSVAFLALSGCGGGGGEAGQVIVAAGSQATPQTAATPSPTPTPVPLPTPAPPPVASAANGEQAVTLTDNVFYSRGQYVAYAAPWCAYSNKTLVVGRDLINTITLYPSKFPYEAVIDVNAPAEDPNNYGCGVYGYHHVAFGNYNGGVPRTAAEPRQVKALNRLEVEVSQRSRSLPGSYNVLHETFLTREAGKPEDKVIEVGWFLHADATATNWGKGGTRLGTHVDPAGRQWQVYQRGTFVMVFPADGRDVETGTIHMKPMFDQLMQWKVLTGEEWFNGMAIGVEPVRGKATMTLERWSIAML
jgi:hypothetical protein